MVPWIEAETDERPRLSRSAWCTGICAARRSRCCAWSRGAGWPRSPGRCATEIDHALRILDFGRAAPAISAAWPPETRAFVQAFVAGLNHARRATAPRAARIRPARPDARALHARTTCWRSAGWRAPTSTGSPISRCCRRAARRASRGSGSARCEAGGSPPRRGGRPRPTCGARRHPGRHVAQRQQHRGGRAARSATGGGADRLRPASRPDRMPNLWLVAGMRSPVLPRGRADGAGAADPRRSGATPTSPGAGPTCARRRPTCSMSRACRRRRSGPRPCASASACGSRTTRQVRITPHGPVVTDAARAAAPAAAT